jgi:predicted nucleotide-binding protein (sugar kinase/HSP70/actin superfamily)
LIEAITALRGEPANSSERVLFVTLGGHCAHQGSDYRRALESLALDGVDVFAPSPAMFARGSPIASLERVRGWPIKRLLDAVIAADLLRQLGCAHRPEVVDGSAVDRALDDASRAIATALERSGTIDWALRSLARTLASLPRKHRVEEPALVRVMGEFVPSTIGGEAGGWLVERIERLGGRARPPLLMEWLLYVLWQLDPVLGARGPRLRRACIARFDRHARTAGLTNLTPDDPVHLATLASERYPSALRGSAGHLEVGTFLDVERRQLADVVVSVKSFASTPSSSVSDAVIHALARDARTAFLAVETLGDGDGHIESRLELALHVARIRRAASNGSPLRHTSDHGDAR